MITGRFDMEQNISERHASQAPEASGISWRALLVGVLGFLFIELIAELVAGLVCMHSTLIRHVACSPSAELEGWNIGHLLASVATLLTTAVEGRHHRVGPRALANSLLAGLVASMAVLLRHAFFETHSEFSWSALATPAYVFTALFAVFVLPRFLMPASPTRDEAVVQIYVRMAMVLAAGTLTGTIAQSLSETAWYLMRGAPLGSSKFGIAPSAVAIASSTWVAASAYPFLFHGRWHGSLTARRVWLFGFLLAGAIIAALYGLLFADRADHRFFGAVQALMLLWVPVLTISVLLALDFPGSPVRSNLVVLFLLTVLVQIVVAALVVYKRAALEVTPVSDAVPFVLAQALAAAAAVGAISLGWRNWLAAC